MTVPQDRETYQPGPLSAVLIALSRNTPLGRGKFRKLMAKGVRALNPGRPLDVPLYGGRARLHHTGNNSEVKALLSPRRYAREEYAFCRDHMPAEAGVFVDIGGNAGVFSLFVASLMDSGKLVAVEPQPNMFDRLQANFALNPTIARRLELNLYQLAVGGAELGTLTLSIPESAGQASAHLKEGVPTIDVERRPLLDLLDESGATKIDLLKIDVEGFEDGVLFPFFDAAPASLYPKAIVMESCNTHLWEKDCEALLLSYGYKVIHRDRTNMMLVLEMSE